VVDDNENEGALRHHGAPKVLYCFPVLPCRLIYLCRKLAFQQPGTGWRGHGFWTAEGPGVGRGRSPAGSARQPALPACSATRKPGDPSGREARRFPPAPARPRIGSRRDAGAAGCDTGAARQRRRGDRMGEAPCRARLRQVATDASGLIATRTTIQIRRLVSDVPPAPLDLAVEG
jgi:hypothetical protein